MAWRGCLVSRTLGSLGASLSFFWAEYAAVIEISSSSLRLLIPDGAWHGKGSCQAIDLLHTAASANVGGMDHWDAKRNNIA
ncbi:hypothetical protein BKA60DRAFT_574731 [Fusarium oxysporum]|nr:hypothetical protein BKA60DRAFT_574731 [Fusarium oxysporum]KAI8419388.1 hypothetical protein FOFC_01970 [Fusarium oxysporum]